MTLKESINILNEIEKVLDDYSTYFVDWERLYYDKEYRPEFPESLIKARKSLGLLATELGHIKANAIH